MTINFQHLRSFYAVSSDQNMTRAANRLNISQPTLSKQIKALEERYSVKLFVSKRPPLELTAIGKKLYEEARTLFEAAERIESVLGTTQPEEGGLMRLGTDSPPHAADFVSQCRNRFPMLDFEVVVANSAGTNDMLLSAAVDLAIVCEPIVHHDYTYVPLYEDHLVAVLPRCEQFDALDMFPLSEINSHVMLVREARSRTLTTVTRMLDQANIVPERTMKMQTGEMIREAIGCGLGFSFMFSKEAPPDSRMRIIPIDVDHSSIGIAGYIAHRTDRKNNPAIRSTMQLARELGPSNATSAKI